MLARRRTVAHAALLKHMGVADEEAQRAAARGSDTERNATTRVPTDARRGSRCYFYYY